MNFLVAVILSVSLAKAVSPENPNKSKACFPAVGQLPLFPEGEFVIPAFERIYRAVPVDDLIPIGDGLSIKSYFVDGTSRRAQKTHVVDASGNAKDMFANSLTMSVDNADTPTRLTAERSYFSAEFQKDPGLPKWVTPENVPHLVEGRGIPLVIFERLHQMKRFEIGKGKLKSAELKDVYNVEALFEYEAIKRKWKTEHPDEALTSAKAGQMMRSVPLVRNFITVLNLSDHRIVAIRVRAEETRSVGETLDAWSIYPEYMNHWNALATSLGLKPSDITDSKLTIEFDLSPI